MHHPVDGIAEVNRKRPVAKVKNAVWMQGLHEEDKGKRKRRASSCELREGGFNA